MTRFNFTGDLEQVQERQLQFIGEVLEKHGYKGPDAKIENVGEAGDNYMSTVKRIIVTENGKTFKMIAKLATDHELMRMMTQTEVVFRNEHTAYTQLLPKFVEIQKSAGVEDLFRYAQCYGSLHEAPYETILLEDLKEYDFTILDRFKPLSIDILKLVLKNLAIYHSLSYVLKHQEPERFEEIKSQLGDLYSGPMTKTEEGKIFFVQLEEFTLSVLTDDKYKKYVRGSVTDVFNLYAKTCRWDADSKRSVIQQGDEWLNNIMFRSEDGVPRECILIDYQLAKESSPVYDVMYFIFNSTSHHQRQENFYELLDYYYSELDTSLQNYGLKASMVYPRDQLDCDLKRYGKLMFTVCIMVTNAIIKKNEDALKMKEGVNDMNIHSMGKMFVMPQETMELFKSKVEGLVDSFVEFGLLSK